MKKTISSPATNNIIKKIEAVSDYLKKFALSLTKDMADADDLVQDTLFSIIKNKDRFNEGTNFKAWSSTIMRNVFINNYRRRKRFLKALNAHTEIKNTFNALENEGEMNIAIEEISAIIDQIELKYRTPFDMYRQGFQYKEISEKLELPIGTVKSQIFHARRKIIKLYQRQYAIPA